MRSAGPSRSLSNGFTERLAYARSRGFRVGLYFADGLTSCAALPGFSRRLVLRKGGWMGPDTTGESYCMNPLAGEVRDFFLRYTDALLREYGNDLDAFVWDETFTLDAGNLGSAEVPGYAARAMMRLVREVAGKSGDRPAAGPLGLGRHGRRRHGELCPGGTRHLPGLLVPPQRVVLRHFSQLAQHAVVMLLDTDIPLAVDRIRRAELPGPGGDLQRLGRQRRFRGNDGGNAEEGPRSVPPTGKVPGADEMEGAPARLPVMRPAASGKTGQREHLSRRKASPQAW